MTVRVGVVGATGRMGTLVCRLLADAEDFELGAAIDSSSGLSGLADSDLIVDVSVPAASPGVVDFAVDHAINILVGTSGWSSDRLANVEAKLAAVPDVGVIVVPNFSLGSVIATRLAAIGARYFDSIEIVESHGPTKIDSPSGTAVRTAELMENARRNKGNVDAPHADQRARGQLVDGIPIHSVRLRGVVARQEVHFGGEGETVTISHDTVSSAAYESGIMLALRSLESARGLTVGLDSLLGLDYLDRPGT